MALKDKRLVKGERRNPSTRIQMGAHDGSGEPQGEEGTYNLIFGELLDEQKDHVRGAVLCVAEGVREWACGRRGGQHR